jgi:hypothetical protein
MLDSLSFYPTPSMHLFFVRDHQCIFQLGFLTLKCVYPQQSLQIHNNHFKSPSSKRRRKRLRSASPCSTLPTLRPSSILCAILVTVYLQVLTYIGILNLLLHLLAGVYSDLSAGFPQIIGNQFILPFSDVVPIVSVSSSLFYGTCTLGQIFFHILHM